MKGAEFEAAAEHYADHIYAIAFNYFKNPYDADDIVQEVLLKLYQNEPGFESEEHLKHWLLRVAVNQCKKISLSAWHRRNVSLETWQENIPEACGEEFAETAARRDEILQGILKLPKKYRIVIHLYYYEDYDTKEIAGALNMKEATVRTRLARGRKLLKEVFSDV